MDDYQNIEEHFYESLHTHFKYSKKQSREIAIHYLKQMGLEKTILNKYPFEIIRRNAQRDDDCISVVFTTFACFSG